VQSYRGTECDTDHCLVVDTVRKRLAVSTPAAQKFDGERLKLTGTHQLLVCADDVNILGGSVHTTGENAEALVVAGREIGPEVNADKTKYVSCRWVPTFFRIMQY